MTEEQWLKARTPKKMLTYLRRRTSERKGLLFACACVRRHWHLLPEDRVRRALETVELSADGLASEQEWQEARREIASAREIAYGLADEAIFDPFVGEGAYSREVEALAVQAVSALFGDPNRWDGITAAARQLVDVERGPVFRPSPGDAAKERLAQVALVREVFGNPFRPVTLDPSWLTWHRKAVVKLARGMYEERSFEDMPILADALEEAGCDDQDILAHCRDTQGHVRGCWVLDLVLSQK